MPVEEPAAHLSELLADFNEDTYLRLTWEPFSNGEPAGKHAGRIDWTPDAASQAPAILVATLARIGRWPGGWGVLAAELRRRKTGERVALRSFCLSLPDNAPSPHEPEAGLDDGDDDDEEADLEATFQKGVAIGAAILEFVPKLPMLLSAQAGSVDILRRWWRGEIVPDGEGGWIDKGAAQAGRPREPEPDADEDPPPSGHRWGDPLPGADEEE